MLDDAAFKYEAVDEVLHATVSYLVTRKVDTDQARTDSQAICHYQHALLSNVAVVQTQAFQGLVVNQNVFQHFLSVLWSSKVIVVDDALLDCVVLAKCPEERKSAFDVEAATCDVKIFQLRAEHQRAGYHFYALVAQSIVAEVKSL